MPHSIHVDPVAKVGLELAAGMDRSARPAVEGPHAAAKRPRTIQGTRLRHVMRSPDPLERWKVKAGNRPDDGGVPLLMTRAALMRPNRKQPPGLVGV